jgi:hypothetical protein
MGGCGMRVGDVEGEEKAREGKANGTKLNQIDSASGMVVGCIGGYGSGYDESLFALFIFQTLFPHPLQFQSPQLFPHYFLKAPKEKDGYGDI